MLTVVPRIIGPKVRPEGCIGLNAESLPPSPRTDNPGMRCVLSVRIGGSEAPRRAVNVLQLT
jgi:hypothetical protein